MDYNNQHRKYDEDRLTATRRRSACDDSDRDGGYFGGRRTHGERRKSVGNNADEARDYFGGRRTHGERRKSVGNDSDEARDYFGGRRTHGERQKSVGNDSDEARDYFGGRRTHGERRKSVGNDSDRDGGYFGARRKRVGSDSDEARDYFDERRSPSHVHRGDLDNPHGRNRRRSTEEGEKYFGGRRVSIDDDYMQGRPFDGANRRNNVEGSRSRDFLKATDVNRRSRRGSRAHMRRGSCDDGSIAPSPTHRQYRSASPNATHRSASRESMQRSEEFEERIKILHVLGKCFGPRNLPKFARILQSNGFTKVGILRLARPEDMIDVGFTYSQADRFLLGIQKECEDGGDVSDSDSDDDEMLDLKGNTITRAIAEETIQCARAGCQRHFKNFLQLKPHVREHHPDVEQYILRKSLAKLRAKGIHERALINNPKYTGEFDDYEQGILVEEKEHKGADDEQTSLAKFGRSWNKSNYRWLKDKEVDPVFFDSLSIDARGKVEADAQRFGTPKKGSLKLTKEEQYIRYYTGRGSQTINSLLWADYTPTLKKILPYVKPLTDLLRDTPNGVMVTTHTQDMSHALLMALKDGQRFRIPCFWSSSLNTDEDRYLVFGNVVFKLTIPANCSYAAEIAKFSKHPGEKEVLISPGTPMEVTRNAIKKKKENAYVYYVIEATILNENSAGNADVVIVEELGWSESRIEKNWLDTSKKALQKKDGVKCFVK